MSARHRLLQRLTLIGLALIAIVVAITLVSGHGRSLAPAPAADPPPMPRDPPREPPEAWLGLDYNSSSGIGRLDTFSRRGIVYDREGGLEVSAGAPAGAGTSLGQALKRSYGARMIPDIEVDPARGPVGCDDDPQPTKFCLPTSTADVTAYVRGFLATARSVLHAFPGKQVLFEPMNEPWDWPSPAGTQSGRVAAREYAGVLSKLLSAAAGAHVPLDDIYVPSTGTLADGTDWVPDIYAAQPCLKPGSGTCGPIEGWSVHPYGLPGSTTLGIDSLPGLHAQMLSGRRNVVVTEIGFCSEDVDRGDACAENLPDIRGTSVNTSHWLAESLHAAAEMHRQGWLKALLVWQRGGGGWAMQNDNGTLTDQGRELELFAASRLGR